MIKADSGKTHTLLGNKEEEGLLTHIIKYLFKEVEQQQKGGGRTFLVQLQVMELYCEVLLSICLNVNIFRNSEIC